MADETKKDQRVKAPVLRAKYKSRTLDEFIEKYSRDISRSGMWIKSGKPPALATLLKVEIQLEDGSPVISAVGRVVKRREEAEATPEAPAGMGIFFLKIEEQSQPVIDRIVALKGEDAGPHFENIRTGQTVRPPSDASHSAFFGSTNPSQQMPAEADRTMMRQMNALLGEALRQVNETAPRKPNDASTVPTQKATIMGVAAPQELLEKAIAASREENRKADEGPTKVATRSEIDNALEKLKSLEESDAPKPATTNDAPKPEAPKVEAKKPEAPKVEAKKSEAPKVEAKKPEAPKVEAKKPEAPKVEAKKPEEAKPETPKAPRSMPPRQATKLSSIPPPPATRPLTTEGDATKAADAKVTEAKADEKAPEAKADEAKAPEAKADEKAPDAKADEAKTDEKADEAKAPEAKADEPKADEPKADEPKAPEAKADEPKADEAKADEKAPEAKADEPKADEKKADEKKADEKKADEAKADEKKADVAVVKKADEKKADEKKTDEKKTDEKKAVAKADEKKPVAKADEKKPATTPPEEEGMNVLVVIGVIALLAFLLYYFLLRGTG